MCAIVACRNTIPRMCAGFDNAKTVCELEAAGLKRERAGAIGEACHKAADVAGPVTRSQPDAAMAKSGAGLMPWIFGAMSGAAAMMFAKLKLAMR